MKPNRKRQVYWKRGGQLLLEKEKIEGEEIMAFMRCIFTSKASNKKFSEEKRHARVKNCRVQHGQ